MSKKTAQFLIREILKKPDIRIGFSTGATPLGLYKELIRAYNQKRVDFSKITSYNLDEYYPIKKDNKNSYYYYMFQNLFNHINIKKSNINLLNGETKNPDKECRDYEKKLRKNPIDVQILGIGVNGHIAFNEPGTSFDSKTRLVKLAPETIKINSGYLKNQEIPKKALTTGVKTIMSAKKILLLASGKNKARAIKCLFNKESSACPVSFLKKHRNLILIIDKEAGSLL